MIEKTKLFAESWNIAFRKTPVGTILSDKSTPFYVIKNSVRYWAADPFLFTYKGDTYIFAELYDYVLRRGQIGYCKILGQRTTPWRPIIQENFHLSYPFIFMCDNEIYIVPESGANKSLILYKAVQFPDVWEKWKVLRENVVLGDTTLVKMNGEFLGLTYDISNPNQYFLKLLHFDNPEKDEVLNFDEIDMRRPAGCFFMKEEKLLRPAQNCVNGYGAGLVFYHCEYQHRNYTEKRVMTVNPEDLALSKKIIKDGIHTYNATNEYEVVDIKTRRLNFINLASRIISKIRGIQ